MKVNMRDVAQVFLLNKSCSQFVNLTVSKKPLSAALKVTKDAFAAQSTDSNPNATKDSNTISLFFAKGQKAEH